MTDPLFLYACLLVLLVLVGGLLAIAFKALTVAHDLAKIALTGGVVTPATAPSVLPKLPSILKPTPASAPTPTPQSTPAPAPAAHPAGDVVLDDKMLAFLRQQEGFTPKAFWDYKQWTNGYGTKALSSTEVIDKDEAEKRLVAEATQALQFIKLHFPNLPIGGEQAMIDFTFNLGEAWASGPVGKLLADGNYAEAKAHMLQYVHAGGKVLDDLVKRRQAEVAMFDHPL